jgi:hypothetical protein
MRRPVLLLAIVIIAASSPRARADDLPPTLRRFALIVSSNDGGRERSPLRFANSDARSIADVLRQLGGLRPEDLVSVPDARRADTKAAFDRLRHMLASAKAGPRREVLVYYSGHSDEEGLLLGAERVTYRELREWITGVGADVRIVVLDSCASGALIRQRGGTRAASFLGDRSVDARGHAFLTASSADEAAQESDRIGAAFFTHYLVSGLRGAADSNRDSVVTLGEAYQFAYQETLRRTENTSGGAQHPSYDIQLAGIGDLVLTDLRATSARLTLDEPLEGRIHVRDGSGRLVVELDKIAARPVVLGLAAGSYAITLDRATKRYAASITLRDHVPARLSLASFAIAPVQSTTARGRERSDDTTAFGGTSWRELRGHIGLSMRYSQLHGLDGFHPMAEVALRIRRLTIGMVGGAVITGRVGSEARTYEMGFGGIVVRYTLPFARTPYAISFGGIAGAGAIEDAGPENNLWLFEPHVQANVNLTRWLRIGIDVGYRLVASPASVDDLDGIAAGLHTQLGWF